MLDWKEIGKSVFLKSPPHLQFLPGGGVAFVAASRNSGEYEERHN